MKVQLGLRKSRSVHSCHYSGVGDAQIELIAQGLSNEEVGQVLGISPRTAKAHCDVLRQKLKWGER